LSLQLLLDEASQDKILLKLLRASGHDVLTMGEANLSGASDIEGHTLTISKEKRLDSEIDDVIIRVNFS
jgi:hypothetical protein